MKHKRWWCYIIFHPSDLCSPCLLRRLRYGFRMDPVGYMAERQRIWRDTRLSPGDRRWILNQAKPVVIVYE